MWVFAYFFQNVSWGFLVSKETRNWYLKLMGGGKCV